MKTRISVTAACVAVAAMLAAPAAYAAPAAPDYVRTAYDGAIYEVTDDDARPLTFDEWAQLGFPAFDDAATVYQKVLSFPTVSAITFFERAGVELTQDVTWDEYRNAGFPAVLTAVWGPDISVHKWGTSDELIAEDAAGDVLKLTYPQWRDAGFPAFTVREGRGFVRLSWDGSGGIAYMCDTAAGKGGRLTYEQWTSLGSPTPLAVTRTANDSVFRRSPDHPSLAYLGAMTYRYDDSVARWMGPRSLTYPEWVAMGSPTPLEGTRVFPDLFCGYSDPSAWS
ncbi:hypothetical protein [Microbacterium sp. lyk4-40-TSB-66]|uniref:hypothetical protein n=1 Tax=Microbacterium sp. lyk4-40-TSB-66 TaxID=3040294 RepID=UPI00254C19E6|nr:hypothetical protein [Microbacterium sp. lyk4-40-TSB-66]